MCSDICFGRATEQIMCFYWLGCGIFSGRIMRIYFAFLCIVIGKWLSLIYSKVGWGTIHAMVIFPYGEMNKTSSVLVIAGHQGGKNYGPHCASLLLRVWSLTEHLSTKLNTRCTYLFFYTLAESNAARRHGATNQSVHVADGNWIVPFH